MDEIIAQWVKPYYLKILHGNYAHLQDNELNDFVSSAKQSLSEIDEAVIERLLLSLGWRERITGSWFAGLKRWDKFTDQIGELLIENNRVYAGQGYCFALGRFTDNLSVSYLTSYLDKYLPKLDCYYDQGWAMAALIWIDNRNESNYSKRYLERDGLWERFVADKPYWSLEQSVSQYDSIMAFCDKWFGAV